MMVDYSARTAGAIEGKWKGDCVSIDAPGRTKGRIWIDETTHDVLRLDEQLTGQFEYRVPREHWGFDGPQTWVIERADSSIRYRPVAFRDPDETVLLPESIEVADGVQRRRSRTGSRRPSPATSASSPADGSSSNCDPAPGVVSGLSRIREFSARCVHCASRAFASA